MTDAYMGRIYVGEQMPILNLPIYQMSLCSDVYWGMFQIQHGGKWVETREALRAGMNWTYSELHQSGSSPTPARRRRHRVQKLTPAPPPIKARLAQKGHVPKLNLDETPHSKFAKSNSAEQLSNAVKDSLSKGSSQPKFMRQHGQRDEVNTPSPPPSPTLAGIEDELSKMEDTALALQNPLQVYGAVHAAALTLIRHRVNLLVLCLLTCIVL